jgi:hypothetical protein
MIPSEVLWLDCSQQPFVIDLADGRHLRSRTVVVSAGARYRRLNVPKLARDQNAQLRRDRVEPPADILADPWPSRRGAGAQRALGLDDPLQSRQMSSQVTTIAQA